MLDTHLRTPLSAKLVQTSPESLWIFCGAEAPNERLRALESLGVHITRVGPRDLDEVLAYLHEARVLSVLVEGGCDVNGAFLRANLVDEAVLFYAETELGPDAIPFAHGGPTPFALEQRMLSVRKQTFGADVCVRGLMEDPWRENRKLP